MPAIKIPTKQETAEYYAMLKAEHDAYQMNQQYNTLKAIRTRAMTKQAYKAIKHGLRRFFWGLKQNKFYSEAI